MDRVVVYLLFLLLTVVPVRHCIPQNGNYEGKNLTFTIGNPNNTVCANLAMQADQSIHITLDKVYVENNEKVNITLLSYLYYSECADVTSRKDCLHHTGSSKLVAYNTIADLLISTDPNFHYRIQNNFTALESLDNGGNTGNENTNQNSVTTRNESTNVTSGSGDQKPSEPEKSLSQNVIVRHKNDSFAANWTTFTTPSSAIYVVIIHADLAKKEDEKKLKGTNITLTFHIEMKNSYGYLSLIDYPSLIVFSILLVVYVFYAFLWLGMMACYFRDIVRLQFWVTAVILLGFLEKVFFVSEYSTANQGQESWGLIYVAESVSAAKRALSRMLIIIICEGFGTVKPRLGSTLTKVVALGALYFVMALVDGIVRATRVTADSHDLTSILTFVMLLLIDTGIVYWVFSALVNTRRTLRLRKNLAKLTVYNHLAIVLIITCAASGAFLFWEAVEIAGSSCSADWKELWLMNCYWHILFCVILLSIMIIWRPSANKLRFAYALVSGEADDEDEMEQGPNKNFENVKMRPVNKLDSKVTTSAEAEEDLKWVEENLPTTAIDKALPLILDTDEEVMTTSFEVSKMK